MNRFFAEKIENNIALLDKDESFHLGAVLRLNPGETVEIVFEGRLFAATVEDNNKKGARVKIEKEIPVLSEPKLQITLFQALPKGSKMDFVVQKCIELGIYEIVPVMSKRCVAKANDNKKGRLNRIAYEACKQCKRVFVPHVEETVDLHNIDFSCYDLAVVAFEDENKTGLRQVLDKCDKPIKVAVIIGPEGGFEKEEITMLIGKGVSCISLGRRILRSETAGMAVLSALLYHYGEMEP